MQNDAIAHGLLRRNAQRHGCKHFELAHRPLGCFFPCYDVSYYPRLLVAMLCRGMGSRASRWSAMEAVRISGGYVGRPGLQGGLVCQVGRGGGG
jgi:hypothetical protein